MAEKNDPYINWKEARLIPVSGIDNTREQERRATSALLAVLSAVQEFGIGITRQFGAPKGNITAFTEVPFKSNSGRKVRPDGLIRVSGRNKSWVALIEVKTGRNKLKKDQLEAYLDIAIENKFDCVLTISNQIERIPGQHPVEIDKRKTNKTKIHHLSWSRVLTQAMQCSHLGVADRDQVWILNELIRYMEHPSTGVIDFNDMGDNWVRVRNAVVARTFHRKDQHAIAVAGKWEELVTYATLRLGRRLGANVQEVLTVKEKNDVASRIDNIVDSMVKDATLSGKIRIPGAIGDISIAADLRARQVITKVKFDAPKNSRPLTRINWLLRQLEDAPASITLESWPYRSTKPFSARLRDVRANPKLLMPSKNKEILAFSISLSDQMGAKRMAGKGSFINSVIDTLDKFYFEVIHDLKKWRPPAENKPALAKKDNEPPEEEFKTEAAPEKDAEPPKPTAESPSVDTPTDEKTTSDDPSVD